LNTTILGLSTRFSGTLSITPALTTNAAQCFGTWKVAGMYVFQGPLTDPELASFTAKVTWGTVKPVNYAKVSDLFSKSLDLKDAYALIPADWKLLLPQVATALDSLPSVLISREDA
jgi:hypothetical protein